MQNNVHIRETFGTKGLIDGILRNLSAVKGEKNLLAGCILTKAHIFSKPAFHATAFIVIAAGALGIKFIPAPKSIDIKLTDIGADLVEILNQLAVWHGSSPFFNTITIPHFPGKGNDQEKQGEHTGIGGAAPKCFDNHCSNFDRFAAFIIPAFCRSLWLR